MQVPLFSGRAEFGIIGLRTEIPDRHLSVFKSPIHLLKGPAAIPPCPRRTAGDGAEQPVAGIGNPVCIDRRPGNGYHLCDIRKEVPVPEEEVGCAKPTGKVLGEAAEPGEEQTEDKSIGEKIMEIARVGGKAPDFEAPAYSGGKFVSVKLSDYLGKWVLMCFYPGDFTFV